MVCFLMEADAGHIDIIRITGLRECENSGYSRHVSGIKNDSSDLGAKLPLEETGLQLEKGKLGKCS